MTPHFARPTALVAGLAALALVAAGCSGTSDSSSTDAATGDIQDGGTVSVGIASSPTGLDPNVASSANDALIMRQIFDSLVVELPDHTYGPWLADSWEISDDGMTYTFTLKEGVTFHDGTDFNADAVKYNIDRILDPETQSQYAASLLGTVEGATVVDDHTVELNLSAPYAPLMEALSQPFLGIESPAAIEEYGDDDVLFHPVGTGPFVFDSYTTDSVVALTANEDYDWAPEGAEHEGAPYLDELDFTIVPETSARIGALQSGELTVANTIPAEQLQTLQSDDSLQVDIVQVPGATYSLYLNQLNEPWDDADARLALRMGIDVDTIVDTLYFGNYERAWSVLSPATAGYDADLEDSWEYDPDGAIAAFEELGWEMNDDGLLEKDGEPLELTMVNQSPNYDKRQEIDEIVQQQLAEIGVTLNTEAFEFTQYAAATQGGEYDMESFSITTGSPSVMWTIFNPDNQPNADQFLYNVAHYVDEDMIEWGEAAAGAADTDEANEYYALMQEKVNDEAVAIPIYVGVSSIGMDADLAGVTFDTRAYALYYGAGFTD